MFTGVDAVVFGVADLDNARRFALDWGLSETSAAPGALRFVTRDGSEVLVHPLGDPMLPPPTEPSAPDPSLREVIWGLTDEAALRALTERLGDKAGRDSAGRPCVRDPAGFTHAFRVTQRQQVAAAGQEVNGPGHRRRVDRRSPVYREAKPLGLGHVVLTSGDLEAHADFFKQTLGWVEADRFRDFGIFLRAVTPGPHHHLFLQKRGGPPVGDHVAFYVDNWHEVLGGGLAMARKGWPTYLGPGFHPVSSAFYWYLESPLGPRFEYYIDDDYCTENWKPEVFSLSPALYVDWAVMGFHRKGA